MRILGEIIMYCHIYNSFSSTGYLLCNLWVIFAPSFPENFWSFKNRSVWDKRHAVLKKSTNIPEKKNLMVTLWFSPCTLNTKVRVLPDYTEPRLKKTCIFVVTTVTTFAITQMFCCHHTASGQFHQSDPLTDCVYINYETHSVWECT